MNTVEKLRHAGRGGRFSEVDWLHREGLIDVQVQVQVGSGGDPNPTQPITCQLCNALEH